MSSVWKHPKSKYWYARFTNSAGIQQNRSTKTTDRRTAERLANQYEDAYRHKLTEVQIRRVMSDINEKLNGQALPSLSVKEFFDDWTSSTAAETSSSTAEKYKGTVRDFLIWLGARAEEDLARITTADLTRWRDAQMKANAPQTVRGKLKILKVAFKRAWRMGVLLDDPAIKVPSPKVKETAPRRPFTIEELTKLFGLADNNWKGILLTGLYTGQRLKDICTLSWSNIVFNGDSCVIKLLTSKTDRSQIIPVAPPLHLWLLENRKKGGPIFPEQYQVATESKNTGRVSHQFGDLLAKAKLVEARPKSHKTTGVGRTAKREVSEISFHSLRHTATSMLKQTIAEKYSMLTSENKRELMSYPCIITEETSNADYDISVADALPVHGFTKPFAAKGSEGLVSVSIWVTPRG